MSNVKELLKCFLIILSFATVYSCATTPVTEKAETETPKLSMEEQEKLSLKEYNNILEMTANVSRRDIIPQLKERHLQLIEKYPDSYFAEESHLRLIVISFEDYYPPQVEEAEKYYKQYFERYPEPRLDNIINDTMVRDYYKYHFWERIVDFLSPNIARYIETGDLDNPYYFFVYCEALYNLKDYVEAEKGYITIIRLYPNSYEAKLSRTKLERIKAITKELKEAD